jgi:viroplasmin and RNaseH domain-containing protein
MTVVGYYEFYKDVKMKIGNIGKLTIIIFITITLGTVNTSLTIGDDQPDFVLAGIKDNFSNPGYKPVSDTCPYVEEGGKLNDNFLYKKWCEETFVNGDYIYEAYKDIAFNIKYTPESGKTDFWQTPVETARLRKGDCEDAVFLFFSQLPSNQKSAEIVWGWVINKQSTMGKAHVWYQLLDKRGQQYIVEGFSKDWNGIIPMNMVEETESRRPILTMAHSAIGKLASLLSEADDQQIYQSLVDLLAAANSIDNDSGNQLFLQNTNALPSRSSYEYIACPANTQGKSREDNTYRGYSTERKMYSDVGKEISNILKKLHELFSRYEKQKKETDVQVAHRGNPSDHIRAGMIKFYPERNLRCKR